MKKLNLILFSILIFLFISKILFADERLIHGIAKVIDGDTIVIKGKKIRLFGIDAPEMKQICFNELNNPYPCGREAKEILERMSKNNKYYCYYSDKDKYNRIIGDCYDESKTSVNGFMVLRGYAVAYKRYSNKYRRQEENAKLNKKGIWRGKFERPEEWRRKNK